PVTHQHGLPEGKQHTARYDSMENRKFYRSGKFDRLCKNRKDRQENQVAGINFRLNPKISNGSTSEIVGAI
ncbi:MAG: hypothetical protein AAFV80_19550, partial [Bacteroidota bacterium]